MKQISEAQIKELLQILFQLNIPVQAHASIQEMFNKLPIITQKDESTTQK